jgi:hypothetical protein
MSIYSARPIEAGNQVAQVLIPTSWPVPGNYFGFRFSGGGPTYVAPVSAGANFVFPGDETFIIP